MALTLGPMHLSNNRNFEVQRTNNFEVAIEGLSDEITLSVQSFALPTISNDPIELSYGNSKVKVAGQANFDDISMAVNDYITIDIERQLHAWRKQVYDPESDAVGWAEKYKRNGRVYQYGPDGTVVRTWRIIGMWPASIESGEMSYDGSEKKQVTMNFSVDKAYIER